MKFYTKGDYYFDIDHLNQLRITGPENHLLMGLGFPYNLPLTIEQYQLVGDQLEIKISLPVTEVSLPQPLVSDIRTLRSHTESVVPHPTYQELAKRQVTEVLPQIVENRSTPDDHVLVFLNTYEEGDEIKEYGSLLRVPQSYQVRMQEGLIEIAADNPLTLTIQTQTNIKITNPLTAPIFSEDSQLPDAMFSPFLLELYQTAKQHIEHLIKTKKTSSFEYGTIFPRDWIESANLGRKDLTAETFDYMYQQSMNYVSETGEGWHEEVIGEYKTKIKNPDELIDRKMIDIETLYVMGVPKLSRRFLSKDEHLQKLRAVGRYVFENARSHELISFKRRALDQDEYHVVGNWRDSENAFPGQKSPLSPYDVNCVFYPVSLEVMRKYHDVFDFDETEQAELDRVTDKWQRNKKKFRLYHPDNLIGYSLALHGRKHKPLPVAHLDESYDLFYNQPTLEEVVSFAQKVVSPEYFYTPAGPILVAADEEAFSTQQYHGKVIWPKQVAFAVAGLARQYRFGLQQNWPEPVLETIKGAVLVTSEASFKAWEDMQAVPELYYYDPTTNKARFYTDQPEYEGQMSLIQLWSAVGCRRIMQEYAYMKGTRVR